MTMAYMRIIPSKTMTTPQWYHPDLNDLPKSTLEFFQQYVGIASEVEVIEHINRIRKEAWDIAPYACVGTFAFLDFLIEITPSYAAIVSRVRDGQTLLDIGCGFGQNLHKLALDTGLSHSTNLTGIDINARLLELSCELFRNQDRFQAEFSIGNVLNENLLAEKKGKLDMIYLGLVLHLFDLSQQKLIINNVLGLLNPRPGSLVLGIMLGGETAGEVNFGGAIYRHSPESFTTLWQEAAYGQWNVQCGLVRKPGQFPRKKDNLGFESLGMVFEAERL